MQYPIYHSQYTAAQIENSIDKAPRINSETYEWELWDISSGAYVGTGIIASDTQAAAKQSIIGANGNWYLWDGTAYADSGKPSRGVAGKTAYESAQDGGYTGTEQQFNRDLSQAGLWAKSFIERTISDAASPLIEAIDDGADDVQVKRLVVDFASADEHMSVTMEAKTVTFNQQNQNGNFASTSGISKDGGNISASSNVLTYTVTSVGPANYSNAITMPQTSTPIPGGHKVLITCEIKPTYVTNFTLWRRRGNTIVSYASFGGSVTANVWNKLSAILSPSSDTNCSALFCYSSSYPDVPEIGDTVQLRNFMAIDLTAIYGAGNEPTTTDEFFADFPDTYYAYTLGTKMSKPYDQAYYSPPHVYRTYEVETPAELIGEAATWDVLNGIVDPGGGADEFYVDPQKVLTYKGVNSVYAKSGSADADSMDITYRVDPTIAYGKISDAIEALGGSI